MTAADDDGESKRDHAYFQAIEATFLRLRGSPLLLAPADWRVARRWRRAGLPLELVERALEELFAARAERGAEGKVSSLRYCAPAVEAAAREWQRLTAAAAGGEPEAFDLGRRLEALADALPADAPSRERVARQIRSLEGDPEQVERRLAELDRELVAAAAARLDGEASSRLAREVETGLERVAERLPAAELERLRERLTRRGVRRHASLPTLSLFSPEARAADA